MAEKDQNTELKILDAAKKEFLLKGMTGARMQEIADKAGINKALLHYYYRSKEKLFLAVFRLVVSKLIPKIEKIIASGCTFEEKLHLFVQQYGGMLLKNQFLPLFVLHEINRNPDGLVKEILSFGIMPMDFSKIIQDEINAGRIMPVEPEQLIINILSMIIFPIAARPLLQGVIYANNKKAYDKALKRRLEDIPKFIINSIKVSTS